MSIQLSRGAYCKYKEKLFISSAVMAEFYLRNCGGLRSRLEIRALAVGWVGTMSLTVCKWSSLRREKVRDGVRLIPERDGRENDDRKRRRRRRKERNKGKRGRRNNQGWQVGGTRIEKGLVDYSSSWQTSFEPFTHAKLYHKWYRNRTF